MEKCNFLSIVISFVRNISLLTYFSYLPDLIYLNFTLHYILVTLKFVKKVITNLDLSKASGPDCIPEAILKNCEPEL